MLLAPPALSLLLLAMNALSNKFPSLAHPMASSKVMGLFYAASWCPDCIGVTPVVDEVYKADKTDSLSVVYISSDKTQDQMSSYVPTGWAVIPFDQVNERTDLKREFGACAGSEAGPLSVSRKFGIPTLIVIQSDNGKVLTTSGVDDVMRDKSGALDKWLNMVE
jgi:nucleoredoxin